MARKTIAELERKLELCQSENETLQRGGRVDADTIISQEKQIAKLTEERDGARIECHSLRIERDIALAWKEGATVFALSVGAGISVGAHTSDRRARAEKDE